MVIMTIQLFDDAQARLLISPPQSLAD